MLSIAMLSIYHVDRLVVKRAQRGAQ